jgi:hypothetical protein
MHRQVDSLLQQSIFQFFCEKAFSLHLIEREVLDFVTLGANNLYLHFVPMLLKETFSMVSLPQGEVTASGTDDYCKVISTGYHKAITDWLLLL